MGPIRFGLHWLHQSLRRRLLLWLLPATILAGLLASVATWLGTRAELEDLLHDQLRYIARHMVVDHRGTGQVAILSARDHPHQRKFKDDDQDVILLQVWQHNQLLFGSGPRNRLPPPVKIGFQRIVSQGEAWETWTEPQGPDLVRIAKSEHSRRWALAGLVMHLFWPVITLFPVLAVVVWFGITYGLRPLDKLTEELATRHAEKLQPLDITHMPEEMIPLVRNLNSLMQRVAEAFIQQKQFVADASHELRTPLMALRLQVELVEHATNPEHHQQALQNLYRGIDRATHLTQQLLTMARLDPEAIACHDEPVDLSELCKSVIIDHLAQAERCGIDLGYAGDVHVRMTGIPELLRILLNNLIDNAIRYTQRGGTVDVVAMQTQQGCCLKVSDNGPGIALSDRQRVFERFYRGEHSHIQGSGLGLAIVKRIADQQGARIELKSGADGSGTVVEIYF